MNLVISKNITLQSIGLGKHNYLTLVIHLDDFCERGTAWRTWNNIQFLDAEVPTEDYEGELAWADYRGSWGNMKELVS